MASSNWTALVNSLSQATIDYGVSAGITPPNGGGSFIFGFNSLLTTLGVSAWYTNQVNFAPTPALKGGAIMGAVQRGVSAGAINFSQFLFIGLQGNSTTDSGYLLGLGDGSEAAHIVLAKGPPSQSLSDLAPGTAGVLRRSTASYSAGTWLQLRLDMIVNANGETRLQVFQNDLVANSVTSPIWTAIPGMTEFVDDPMGINSGTQPFTAGYMGFGVFSKDVQRRSYFDHIVCRRQT